MSDSPIEAPEFIVLEIGRPLLRFIRYNDYTLRPTGQVNDALMFLISTYSKPNWDHTDIEAEAYAYYFVVSETDAQEQYLRLADQVLTAIYDHRVHNLLHRFDYQYQSVTRDGRSIILHQNLTD